jgi:hypothetical protein
MFRRIAVVAGVLAAGVLTLTLVVWVSTVNSMLSPWASMINSPSEDGVDYHSREAANGQRHFFVAPQKDDRAAKRGIESSPVSPSGNP